MKGELMAIYHGVVKDNRVELEAGVRLADGLPVEVRPWTTEHPEQDTATEEALHAPGSPASEKALEDAFKHRLRAEGRLAPVLPQDIPRQHTRRLIDVMGQPLSEQIIGERR
jgi:hypothetical protein